MYLHVLYMYCICMYMYYMCLYLTVRLVTKQLFLVKCVQHVQCAMYVQGRETR